VSVEAPILLLLHDAGRSSDQWREFVPLLESRFRVIAPDLPDEARAAVDLVRGKLGDRRFGVIGHGTGGSLAQVLAADGRVEAMVLLDAPRAAEADDRVLASFDFPVLLLWGEDDAVVPVSVAEELNDAIATSTLGLLPGCGHDLTDEAAATIAPIILEYLRARYLKASHDHGPHHGPDHAHDGVVRIQLERRPPWVDLEEDERDDWFTDDDADAEADAEADGDDEEEAAT
jgi:pimeloyl-ACP methyl ester carboxylesterase